MWLEAWVLPLCGVYRALSPPAQATLTQALVALIGALLLLGLIHGPRPEWLSRAVLCVAAWAQSEKEKKWKMEQFTRFMTAGDELLVGLVDKNELRDRTMALAFDDAKVARRARSDHSARRTQAAADEVVHRWIQLRWDRRLGDSKDIPRTMASRLLRCFCARLR